MNGRSLPVIRTAIPGPRSRSLVGQLAQTECPAITARRARRAEAGGVDQDPIVWEAAKGANVVDVDGNVYVDLTAAFAVSGLGHGHPVVADAAARQSQTLIHAMGDVYPSRVKIELATRLAEVTPGRLRLSILAMAGSEAVEAALKTAAVATGRAAVLAFSGAYHGLGYGALSVTAYRREFRAPLVGQLGRFAAHLPYPYCYRCPLGLAREDCGMACLELVRHALDNPASGLDDVGAVMVEPIQGRGGMVVPPDGWLRGLAELCQSRGVLLIFDEIFTGFGRTGRWFACEHTDLVPDVMCLGKAMGGGFPISAAIGSPEVMGRWGLSAGEAIHTSTFLGNPLGCAMALAALEVLETEGLVERSAALGARLRAGLGEMARRHELIGEVRGRGSMLGVELVTDRDSRGPASRECMSVTRQLLERGFLVLPSGVHGNVIGLTPPFVLTDRQADAFLEALDEVLERVS